MNSVALPSGTVAFLFTDIEGSTVRWDRDPSAMQDAVRRHDALMRAAIAEQDGHVFKTIGDAFCAVFWRVDQAARAALAAQRALAEADFSAVDGVRVRMALHVGTSDERDGDYFGPTLNRVARLLAIGYGGQVLVSGSAAEIMAAELDDVELRDLGDHRLKDLSARERVFQLTAAGLRSDFPKLRSLEVFDTNLPQQMSSFIGREKDVADIEHLLEDARLVTLFGAGGLGKTRCCQHVGRDLLERFSDGVWFVDLAPLSDPNLVASEVASVFGVQEQSNRGMLDTLVAHLERKNALLLLDNCEHVVGEAATTAGAVLAGCPKIKIVATSREPLKLAGERVYRMPTLELLPSIALFEERARAANHAFVLSDEDMLVAGEICRRLDGIPLAIELAAARMKILSPKQLAKQLDERFRVLTGGDRTALPRQQTMRALIDWSYDLLSASEQRLFRDVSIFAGTFSLQAATAVCVSDELGEFDVLDLLASLIDKSLVLAEPREDESRYRLLESIRQYGREKSIELGEAESLAGRHALAYAQIAEHLERDYEVVPSDRWLAEAESEIENVRAALVWSFGPSGDPLVGQRLAVTLRRVWLAFASVEACRWVAIAHAAAHDATPLLVLARLNLAEATLVSTMNQFRKAAAAAERALTLFEEAGDARGTANAQRWMGRSLVYLGQVDEGEALLLQSLATLRSLGFKRIGGTLRDLATARSLKDDADGARTLFAEALHTFKQHDDEYNVAVTAGTLAEAEFRCGQVEAAVWAGEEGLAAARARHLETRVITWLLGNLAAFYVELSQFEKAREYAREVLRSREDPQVVIDVVLAMQHLAAVAALRTPTQGEAAGHELSARLIGYVNARLSELQVTREYTEQHLYEKIESALSDALDDGTLARLHDSGKNLTQDRAVELALAV